MTSERLVDSRYRSSLAVQGFTTHRGLRDFEVPQLIIQAEGKSHTFRDGPAVEAVLEDDANSLYALVDRWGLLSGVAFISMQRDPLSGAEAGFNLQAFRNRHLDNKAVANFGNAAIYDFESLHGPEQSLVTEVETGPAGLVEVHEQMDFDVRGASAFGAPFVTMMRTAQRDRLWPVVQED